MTEEDELFWCKIQGPWHDANYRKQLALKGKCLNTLMHDINRPVKRAARNALVDQILNNIKSRKNEKQ